MHDNIAAALPAAVQCLLLSATITPDLDQVRTLFLHNPETVDCDDEDAAATGGGGLKQYWLRTYAAPPLDPSTPRPFDPSTHRPFDPTQRPNNTSTPQPCNPSTLQPLNPSTVRPNQQ